MILGLMAWVLLFTEEMQARPQASQMEKFLQQQIEQERQKRAQTPQKKPKKSEAKSKIKQAQKPRTQNTPQKPFYRILLIAGWRGKLQADLLTPQREVIRVKIGDRLSAGSNARSSRPFIVEAITEKNVRLVQSGRTFLLPMARLSVSARK